MLRRAVVFEGRGILRADMILHAFPSLCFWFFHFPMGNSNFVAPGRTASQAAHWKPTS